MYAKQRTVYAGWRYIPRVLERSTVKAKVRGRGLLSRRNVYYDITQKQQHIGTLAISCNLE